MEELPEVAQKKNKWLVSQVDVEYPTPESLKGRDLYLAHENPSRYTKLNTELTEHQQPIADEVYLVDFHRLTVMFSILQASRWDSEEERAYVLEFFSQIILNDECQLFVGFANTTPVGCAIVTHAEDDVLISDVVVDGSKLEEGQGRARFSDSQSARSCFEMQLIRYLGLSVTDKNIWVNVKN